MLGDLYSLLLEGIRLGNSHLSCRAFRIPWTRHRFELFVAGSVLIIGSLYLPELSWHIAITATVCPFTFDVAEYWASERKLGDPAPSLASAAACIVAVWYLVVRRRCAARISSAWAFSFLTLTAVAASWVKSAMQPRWTMAQVIVQVTFTTMALALAWMLRVQTRAEGTDPESRP
jgi:hypothetical protein